MPVDVWSKYKPPLLRWSSSGTAQWLYVLGTHALPHHWSHFPQTTAPSSPPSLCLQRDHDTSHTGFLSRHRIWIQGWLVDRWQPFLIKSPQANNGHEHSSSPYYRQKLRILHGFCTRCWDVAATASIYLGHYTEFTDQKRRQDQHRRGPLIYTSHL